MLFDFVFAADVPLAIHWRWGSIQVCLTRLLEVRHSLRRFWSIEVYLQGSDRDEEMEEHSCDDDRQKARAEMREHLKLADEAIKDDYFWGACVMLAALQNVLASIEAFCSGCPCHGAGAAEGENTSAATLEVPKACRHHRQGCILPSGWLPVPRGCDRPHSQSDRGDSGNAGAFDF